MRSSICLDLNALGGLDMPVISVDETATIKFANEAAEALAEDGPLAGRELAFLVPDPVEWARIRSELAKRPQGVASAYVTAFTRPRDGRRIPVSIFAVPAVGNEGKIVGSMAFIRDLRERQARSAMHTAIENLGCSTAILDAVSKELHELIDFDSFRVTLMSERRTHLRQLYPLDDRPAGAPNVRWIAIEPNWWEMIDDDRPKDLSLDELYSRPDFEQQKETHAPTKAYLAQGFKRILSLPVKLGPRVVAFIGLDRKRPEPFAPADIERCGRLPLAEAVLMALRYEETARLRMALALIHDLANESDDIGRAAQVLVDRLAQHFGWEHVSIFQLDEDSGGFRILRQARGNGTLQLPDDFWQGSSEGLVGLAFNDPQSRTINASDVHRGRYAGKYARGVPGTVSELCMRVPGSHSRWVLNIESSQENAFAEEEKETVELLVREAGLILERAALLEFRKAVLASINDAVITTDRRGTIRSANPAAGRLIGCPPKALRATLLSDVIVDPDTARAMGEPDALCRRETVLVRRDGQRVPVLLSAELMPANLGGKVFVLSDLTFQKELQRLGLIREVFRQAALETKVPLSLAASYLAQIKAEGTVDAERIDRILKQLRKVDLPLERLMRLAAENSEPEPAAAKSDVQQVVGGVLRELADADASEVVLDGSARGANVAVSRETLAFCVESMLSFALRTRPLDRRVRVAVQTEDGFARVSVAGDWQPLVESGGADSASSAWRRRAIIDLSLGEQILDDVARKAGGEFHTTLDNDAPLKLELELPLSGARVP